MIATDICFYTVAWRTLAGNVLCIRRHSNYLEITRIVVPMVLEFLVFDKLICFTTSKKTSVDAESQDLSNLTYCLLQADLRDISPA